MQNKKSEKVKNFEKQVSGTILSVLDLVGLIPLLLIIIGIFLPYCHVDIVNESIGLFDFTDQSMIGFFINLLVGVCGYSSLINDGFRNMILDEKINKEKGAKYLLIISLVLLLLPIIFAILNMPVVAIADSLGISENALSLGAGCVMVYIGGILGAFISVVKQGITYTLFTGKVKIENLTKIIKIPSTLGDQKDSDKKDLE